MSKKPVLKSYRCRDCDTTDVVCEDHICTERIYHTRVRSGKVRKPEDLPGKKKHTKTAKGVHTSRRVYCAKCWKLLDDLRGMPLHEHLKGKRP